MTVLDVVTGNRQGVSNNETLYLHDVEAFPIEYLRPTTTDVWMDYIIYPDPSLSGNPELRYKYDSLSNL